MALHIKNAREIAGMRESGRILALILEELGKMVVPGATPMDLERRAEELCRQYGVKPGFKGYHGYQNILCISVNDHVVHGIPNQIPFKNGDVLSVDGGVIYDQMNSDSAIALMVGQGPAENQKLVNACIDALWAGIEQVRPGAHVGDIGHAIEAVVRKAGFKVIKDLTGHGIGYTLHEEPYVYNYGHIGQGAMLKPGMTIAIEPIICNGNPEIETLEDDWTIATVDGSLSVQHEHTILVTENGYEVLTLRPSEKR